MLNLNIAGTLSVNSEKIRLGRNSGGQTMGLSSIAIGDGSGGKVSATVSGGAVTSVDITEGSMCMRALSRVGKLMPVK